MVYEYSECREKVFTDQGQRLFIKVRDRAFKLLDEAGAFKMEKILCLAGDNWLQLACIDRMVELNEIVQVNYEVEIAQQHRVFVRF